jgi:hypothetical protein
MPRATSRSDSASVARKSLGFGWEDGLDGAVAVRQTLTAADGVLHFGAPKAKAGERVMPLPPFVARALQRHRKAQASPPVAHRRTLRAPPQPVRAGHRQRDRGALPAGLFPGRVESIRQGARLPGGRPPRAAPRCRDPALGGGVPDAVAASILGYADTRILRRYQDVVRSSRRMQLGGWTVCSEGSRVTAARGR